MVTQSSGWEVADIFRIFGEAYRAAYRMPIEHLKVMDAIMACRTPQMGGHIKHCNDCGHEFICYHSCRNRHCPKCQALPRALWLQARMEELLPVKYFHTVFTLPHELNPLILRNKAAMLDILFKAVSQTLLTFGRNKLGGKLGFIAVLHTWNQLLMDHFHIHCLVPGGALREDGSRWISTSYEKYLFPVRALSTVFREKYIDLLEHVWHSGALIFPGSIQALKTPQAFKRLIGQLRSHKWVVYSKPPFAGPEKVLEYLGRYTHRIAISNHRILNVNETHVTFSYIDRRDNIRKEITLEGIEFIRRFLLHVVPRGFMRIRSFGFLANRNKRPNITRIRELLKQIPPPKMETKSTRQLMLELTGMDIDRCPLCGNTSIRIISEVLPRISRKAKAFPSYTARVNSS